MKFIIIYRPTGWETEGKLAALAELVPEPLRTIPGKPSRKLRISLSNSARGNVVVKHVLSVYL